VKPVRSLLLISWRGILAIIGKTRLVLDYVERYPLRCYIAILLRLTPTVIRGNGAY